eukprot:scaffold36275_cov154-Isochrysis_galbana.AAC.29
MPDMPAAGSPWPQFALILPICRASASSRAAMMADLVDRTSMGSPSGVPVPCASTQLSSEGGVAAARRSLERQRVAALATGITVGTRVESVATALGRGHARGGHHHARPLAEDHIEANHKRGVALPVLHGAEAVVRCDNSRRARCVDGRARTLQPQGEGHAARRDGARRRGCGVDGTGAHARAEHLGILGRPHADVDAGEAAEQARLGEAGAVESLVALLEGEPLRRLHDSRFGRRDAEKGVVEELRVQEEARVALPIDNHLRNRVVH